MQNSDNQPANAPLAQPAVVASTPDIVEQQRHALENLITTIRPLLPKISHSEGSKSTPYSLNQPVSGDPSDPPPVPPLLTTLRPAEARRKSLNAVFRKSEPAPPPLPSSTSVAPPPRRTSDAADKQSGRRKSLKDIFKVPGFIVPEPQIHPSSGSSVPSIHQSSAQKMDTLASVPMSDSTLALALASLCTALYCVMDTMDHPNAPAAPHLSHAQTEAGIEALTSHAKQIAQFKANNDALLQNTSHEQKALWTEIDKMMALVQTLCLSRCYALERPPGYESAASAINSTMLSVDELHRVADAIDRVIHLTPKMFDQTVTLSERQERRMDEAAITALIERLFKGREEFQAQRASVDYSLNMSRLVDQIPKASNRSMDNQRVETSVSRQQKMETAKFTGAVEAQERTRYKNQDWYSKEALLIDELSLLQKRLMAKEKEIFLGRVIGKMNADSAFDSQTAISITRKKKDDEIDKLMEKISKASVQLSSQRA
ncbi:hypothetical protein HDU98_012122 [Podochytrium sp. JEL0797]|nr:hypothetical protein HDU98_012122 [Podochytrium sp. JEL0797]